MKIIYLKKALLGLFLLSLIACPRPKALNEAKPPRDFASLDALLLEGEPRREEAQALLTDAEGVSHVISLLSQYETPGGASALAWSAHHVLLALGAPALLSLEARQEVNPLARFTEARLLRRLGRAEAPASSFYDAFCRAPRRGPILLRYESGREEAEGRVSMQINEEGKARLSIKHTLKPFFTRSFTLSEIELGFLFDRVCASYFWEGFPRRERGADGEDGVSFSVSIQPEAQETVQAELTVWGGEWRLGPAERLAKMLDATVARGKQTSLLLP